MERTRPAVIVISARLLLLIALLACWQYGAMGTDAEFYVSTPAAVGSSFWKIVSNGDLIYNSWITTVEAFIGFLIGGTTGVVAGVLLGRAVFLADVLDPFLTAFYSLPKIALAPLFLLWFGIGIEMKIILAAVTVFFLVFSSTYTGVRQVSRELLVVIRLMGASEHQLLSKVVVPSAMTWVFAGLHLSVPYALIGAIVGEMIASNRGLGYLVANAAAKFDTPAVFAALIAIVALASALNIAVVQIERLLMPWKEIGARQEVTV